MSGTGEKERPVAKEEVEKLEKALLELQEMGDQFKSILLLMEDKKRFVLYNLMAGILRGVGTAIGATVVFALIINIAMHLIDLNLPLISTWLANLIDMIEMQKGHLR